MLHFETKWAEIPYNQKELITKMSDLKQFKNFIPQNQGVSITEDGRQINLENPKLPVKLCLNVVNFPEKDGFLHLVTEEKSSIAFSLKIHTRPIDEKKTEICLVFEEKSINMFLKPFVKKTLEKFFPQLGDQITHYFKKTAIQ